MPRRLRRRGAAGLFAVVAACASAPKPPIRQANVLAEQAAAPLARIDDLLLGAERLPQDTHRRLWQLEDDCAQRQLVTLWAGIEDAVGDQLLSEEAARRKLSLAAFLQQEVAAKVGVVDEAEAVALYEANRALIDVPYAEAAETLRHTARQDKMRALRRALVDGLRARRDVQLYLPPLHLHRVQVDAQGPALGPADAAVTVVFFGDFACSYSAQARRTLKRLRELYPDSLRVVFRHHPLPEHPTAQRAALAAICAGQQDGFWPFAERLFEQPGAFDDAQLLAYARLGKLDLPAFASCRTAPQTLARLQADLAAGQAAGVRGTPSLFVNGMPLIGVLPLAVMQSLIDAELHVATAGKP